MVPLENTHLFPVFRAPTFHWKLSNVEACKIEPLKTDIVLGNLEPLKTDFVLGNLEPLKTDFVHGNVEPLKTDILYLKI